MHVHFVGERDDGVSVSSHHARALDDVGVEVSFAPPEGPVRAELADVEVIHLVTRAQLNTSLFRRLVACRVAGAPIVRFWTGRDVLWAHHHEPTREISRALARLGAVQLCRSEDAVSRLTEIGIEASVGPIVNPNLSDRAQPHPFPSHFTALCYLPSTRRRFCGGQVIDKLISELEDVRFLVLGDTATDYSSVRNVESLGAVEDISRAILRSTVVLQPRLDQAISRLSLEALSHGRHVVGNHAWPFCHRAVSVEDYVRVLRELRFEPSFNLEGREHVCRTHDRRMTVKSLCDVLTRLTSGSPARRRIVGGWLGVGTVLRNASLLKAQSFDPPEISEVCGDDAFAALLDDRVACGGVS